MPKVTVAICAYNAQMHIEETIISVLNQTFQDFELLIIDDGSQDLTGEICKKYSLIDHRIRYYYQKNAGFGDARNQCINLANSEWIAIIDHDDVCLPNRLELQYKASIENPNACLIFSDSEHFLNDGTIVRRQFSDFNPCYLNLQPRYALDELLINGCFIDSETAFFKKSAAVSVGGFNTQWRYINDYDLFLKMALKYELYGIDSVLSKWRIHESQVTGKSYKISISEHIELYQTWLLDKSISKKSKSITKLRIFFYYIRSLRLSLIHI